jgi:hypothetical protein
MGPPLPEPTDDARHDSTFDPSAPDHNVALGRIRDRLDRARQQLDEMEGSADDGR